MQRLTGVILLATFFHQPALVRSQERIDVKVVKYAGLAKEIVGLRGYVVVVDIWAHW